MNAEGREKAHATLQFVGDGLDPSIVSAALDLQPTFSVRKGEPYRRGSGNREYIGRTGVWNLSTEASVRSDRLQEHLDFLTGLLLARPERLDRAREMVRGHGYRAGVSCFWYGPSRAHEPSIPRSFRDLINGMGGDVEVDFYPDDGSEEQAAAE